MRYSDYLALGKQVNESGECVFEECPSCGDAKWHFYYNVEKEVGHCKKCDYAPNRRKLCTDLGITDTKAAPLLESIVDSLDSLDALDIPPVEDEDASVLTNVIPLPLNAQPVYHYDVALRYLLKRGLMLPDLFDFEILYCAKGKYAGRIVFPVRDLTGMVVGFTSRGIFSWSTQPKYKTPGGFKVAQFLYGEDAIPLHADNLIIVEGPFDRIALAGETAIATFGKSISHAQLRKLLHLCPRSISLVYDSDAREAILKFAALLSYYVPVKPVLLPHGDPGSLSRRTVVSLIEQTPYYASLDWSMSYMNTEGGGVA